MSKITMQNAEGVAENFHTPPTHASGNCRYKSITE
jgi:hypothetical protein